MARRLARGEEQSDSGGIERPSCGERAESGARRAGMRQAARVALVRWLWSAAARQGGREGEGALMCGWGTAGGLRWEGRMSTRERKEGANGRARVAVPALLHARSG